MDVLTIIAWALLVPAAAYLVVAIATWPARRRQRLAEAAEDPGGHPILNITDRAPQHDEPTPDRMRKLAGIFAATAARVWNETFDFTIDSIPAVDRAIMTGWGEDAPEVGRDVRLAFGAYVGEVLVLVAQRRRGELLAVPLCQRKVRRAVSLRSHHRIHCTRAEAEGAAGGMIRHETSIRVRYPDTDQMGIVYHGRYLEYFETGRTEMLRSLGLAYSEIEREGMLLPVLEAHVVMKSPARYDEVITVVTEMREPPTARLELHYAVMRGETLLATGSTLHAFVLAGTMRPVRPPRSFLAAVARA
jgi:acyl-CoA thioester hydrolase